MPLEEYCMFELTRTHSSEVCCSIDSKLLHVSVGIDTLTKENSSNAENRDSLHDERWGTVFFS